MLTVSRRQFLKGAVASSLVGGGINISKLSHAGGLNNEILVYVFLRGGIDGLSLMPPISGADRGFYETARPVLKIPLTGAEAALDINGLFGFHSAASGMLNLYNSGKLAIVHAVGMPTSNRSHFEAETLLELGTPDTTNTSTGWLTRHFTSATNLPPVMSVPAFASANSTPKSLLGNPSVLTMSYPGSFSLSTSSQYEALQQASMDLLYGGSSSLDVAGAQALNALDIVAANNWEGYMPANGAQYPSNGLGYDLQLVAQMIKLDEDTRICTADYGGWDTHTDQGNASGGWFYGRVNNLSEALQAFYSDMDVPDGTGGNYIDRITLVVHSEFGRRLNENADAGTDHGYGNAMYVMGGQVNGGQIYGTFPGMAPGQLENGADVIATTDFRQVLSEVLIRRLANPMLGDVFPGYLNYTPLGVTQGVDLPPDYGAFETVYANGFE